MREGSKNILLKLGAVALLGLIFGVPAVLIPVTMNDVPERSETKLLTTYQRAIDVVKGNFEKHATNHSGRRLLPLPEDSMAWIYLINPMGRQGPSGGFAIRVQADKEGGAIGVAGNNQSVTITLPAYRTLQEERTTIKMMQPSI